MSFDIALNGGVVWVVIILTIGWISHSAYKYGKK